MRWTMMLAALALGASCATTPNEGRPLCYAEVSAQERSFPTPDTWYSLLLHGYDARLGAVPRPATDCAGSPVVWQEPTPDECREPGPRPEPLPVKERLTEEDLALETLRANVRLVWVLTRRFTNGEALGPIALVETTDKGFEVKALGSLRGLPRNALMRLEKVGDTQVLLVEGEACTSEEPQVCRRAARLLPLRRGRFFAEPISDGSRSCLGSTWLPLSREQRFELPNGLIRRFELTTTLTFNPESIGVQEQVTVSDSDPRQPSIPERLFRRAQAERTLRVESSVLTGSAPSLWIRMVEQQLTAGARSLPDKFILPSPAAPEPPQASSTPKPDGAQK